MNNKLYTPMHPNSVSLVNPEAPLLQRLSPLAISSLWRLADRLLIKQMLEKRQTLGHEDFYKWRSKQKLRFEESLQLATDEYLTDPPLPSGKRGRPFADSARMTRYYIQEAWETFGIEAKSSAKAGSSERFGPYVDFFLSVSMVLQSLEYPKRYASILQASTSKALISEFLAHLPQLRDQSSVVQDGLKFIKQTLYGKKDKKKVA